MKAPPLLAIAALAVALALGTTTAILAPGRDAASGASRPSLAQEPGPKAVSFGHPVDTRSPDTSVPARRWPAEIEQLLLSSMPQVADSQGASPMVETDQRCSRVEDGLAHCVMRECQTAAGRTACFEMVVTARRLSGPPVSLREDGNDGAAIVPGRLDTRSTSRL